MLRFTVGLLARLPAYAAGAVFAVRYRLLQDRQEECPDHINDEARTIYRGVSLSRLRCASVACPCCGYVTLGDSADYKICLLCEWKDDGTPSDQPDIPSVANGRMTLAETRSAFRDQMHAYVPGPLVSQYEWLARRQIIDAFEALKRARPGQREEQWESIGRCEQLLQVETDRRRREAVNRSGPPRPRIPIGYWHFAADDGWPHPQELVDWAWEPLRRWRIARYLESGRVATKYMGSSYCRIGCWRKYMGTVDLTDGVWVWPEGLAHYVAFHGVRLPDEFVAYAALSDFRIAVEPGLEHVAPNWETFWEDWSREHARFDYEPNCWACAQHRGQDGPGFFSRWQMLGRRMLRPVLRWAGRRKQPRGRS